MEVMFWVREGVEARVVSNKPPGKVKVRLTDGKMPWKPSAAYAKALMACYDQLTVAALKSSGSTTADHLCVLIPVVNPKKWKFFSYWVRIPQVTSGIAMITMLLTDHPDNMDVDEVNGIMTSAAESLQTIVDHVTPFEQDDLAPVSIH